MVQVKGVIILAEY